MDSDMMSDEPSSRSDTLHETVMSPDVPVYAAGASEAMMTTPPPLSDFTLPDPSSVPPVFDDTEGCHRTETSASHRQEATQASEGEPADLLKGPEREANTFGRFKNCDICQVVMNSASQAEMHYAGKTHQKKLRRIAEMKGDSDTEEILSSGFSILPSASSTAKGLAMPHCDICGLTFTAMSQAKMHLSGARHAKKLRQQSLSAKEEVADPSGSKHKNVVEAAFSAEENRLAASMSNVNSEPESNFTCAPCSVSTNSEQQYLQHMGSQRHRNKLLHRERESNRHRPYPPKQDALQKKLASSIVDFKQNEKSGNTSKASWGKNTRTKKVPYGARYNNSRSQAGSFTGSRTFHQDDLSPMGPSRNNPPYQQTRCFVGSGRGNSLNQQCRVPNQDQSDDSIYIPNDPNLLSSVMFPNQDGSFGRSDMANSAVGDNGVRNDASNFDDSWVYSSANHLKLGFGRGSGWNGNRRKDSW